MIVFAMTPTVALADTFMIGAGVRDHIGTPSDYDDTLDDGSGKGVVPALITTLVHHFDDGLALGLHVDVSWRTYHSRFVGNMVADLHDYTEVPFGIGAAVQYTRGKAWVMPWVGPHLRRRESGFKRCAAASVRYRAPGVAGGATWGLLLPFVLDVARDRQRLVFGSAGDMKRQPRGGIAASVGVDREAARGDLVVARRQLDHAGVALRRDAARRLDAR